MKVEAVQGKQVPLEWTETPGGLLEWWHDHEVPLAFPVESDSSLDAMGMPGIRSRPSKEKIRHLELRGGNGDLLDVVGTLVLFSSGDGFVGELLELQQVCEIPFVISRG